MDWGTLANMLAGAIVLKTIEGTGSEAGKSIYNTLFSKTQAAINTIRRKFSSKQDDKSLQILSQFEENPAERQKDLEKALKEAASDAAFAREIQKVTRSTRNAFLDCLEGFTSEDLDKVTVRLGFRPGDLYSTHATNYKKAEALLDKIEAQRRYPELVEEMLSINPYLA